MLSRNGQSAVIISRKKVLIWQRLSHHRPVVGPDEIDGEGIEVGFIKEGMVKTGRIESIKDFDGTTYISEMIIDGSRLFVEVWDGGKIRMGNEWYPIVAMAGRIV